MPPLTTSGATHRCTRNVEEPEGIALDCVMRRRSISGSTACQTALAHAWQCLERGLFGAGPRSGSCVPPARHEAWALRARSWGGWGPGTSALVTGRGQKASTGPRRAALSVAGVSLSPAWKPFLSGFVLVSLPHRATGRPVTWEQGLPQAGCVASPCGPILRPGPRAALCVCSPMRRKLRKIKHLQQQRGAKHYRRQIPSPGSRATT
jgi:hypothetical protein